MNGVRDSMSSRMKKNYEHAYRIRLTRRTPVIIRVDGKAFHTFTKKMKRPFDTFLKETFNQTMLYLCKNIQNCVLGYHQSDEISLLLIDYKKLTSESYLDNEVQKITSISASMATMFFNLEFVHNMPVDEAYEKVAGKAMFDSRCFNLPESEVANYFYWRQLDATRNSINQVGQANFSHKFLHGKSCNDIQNLLLTEKNINWNDYPTQLKRGSACIKKENSWAIDREIPIWNSGNRNYIEDTLAIEED